jgi:hypothetical protein
MTYRTLLAAVVFVVASSPAVAQKGGAAKPKPKVKACGITAIPLSVVWLALGLWLGRRQAVLAGDRDLTPPIVGGILIPSSSTSNAS